MRRLLEASFALFCLLAACTTEPPQTKRAFYHWKRTFDLSEEESRVVKSLDIKRLYVNVFDIDLKNSKPQVMAKTRFESGFPERVEGVPVVYITNRTFLQAKNEDLAGLAKTVADALRETPFSFGEVQFDCDWSLKTKERFFGFLEDVKKEMLQVSLSATIRLHQVKFYKKTGVPPVERGTLMFYNMGEVGKPETENSIYDYEAARAYLENFDSYPLKLDVALPLFSWGVVLREGKGIHLYNRLSESDLAESDEYERVGERRYRVVRNHYRDNKRLYVGDIVRIEAIGRAALLRAAAQIAPHVRRTTNESDTIFVTLYHLDERTLKPFDNETLQNAFDLYR